MLEFLGSPSFRRIVAALVAVALPIINKTTGLELDDAQLVAIIAAIGVYIAQSGLKAATQVKADAHVQAAALLAPVAPAAPVSPAPDAKPTPNMRAPFP